MKVLKSKPVLLLVTVFLMSFIFVLTAAPGTADLSDSSSSFAVHVDVGTLATGYFSDFSGLGSENESVVVKATAGRIGPTFDKLIPGKLKTYEVELKRMATENMDFYNWRKMVEDGNVAGARKTVTIVLVDSSDQPFAKWTLTNTWPSKIRYDMEGSSVIERITLVYERIQREEP